MSIHAKICKLIIWFYMGFDSQNSSPFTFYDHSKNAFQRMGFRRSSDSAYVSLNAFHECENGNRCRYSNITFEHWPTRQRTFQWMNSFPRYFLCRWSQLLFVVVVIVAVAFVVTSYRCCSSSWWWWCRRWFYSWPDNNLIAMHWQTYTRTISQSQYTQNLVFICNPIE